MPETTNVAQKTFFTADKDGPHYSLEYLLGRIRKALPSVGFTCHENDRGELVIQTGMFRATAVKALAPAPHCGPCAGECEDKPCEEEFAIQWAD